MIVAFFLLAMVCLPEQTLVWLDTTAGGHSQGWPCLKYDQYSLASGNPLCSSLGGFPYFCNHYQSKQ